MVACFDFQFFLPTDLTAVSMAFSGYGNDDWWGQPWQEVRKHLKCISSFCSCQFQIRSLSGKMDGGPFN